MNVYLQITSLKTVTVTVLPVVVSHRYRHGRELDWAWMINQDPVEV
jgi:hypothetical protein